MLKKILKNIIRFSKEINLVCRYLLVIGLISFLVVCISVFDLHLDANGNLVTIRAIFSSIAGYILEKSTKTCNSNPKLLKTKVLLVGNFAIMALLVIISAYFFKINVNNPSLILIKNLLFSSIGFLTSTNKVFDNKDF